MNRHSHISRPLVVRLQTGTRFWYDGDDWTVVGVHGGYVRVRSTRHGLGVLAIDEVMLHAEFVNPDVDSDDADEPDPSLVVGEADAAASPVSAPGLIDSIKPVAEDDAASRRLEAVNFLLTGYADGIENPRVDPHPEYGPQNGKTLEERIALMAFDLGKGTRSIERWLREFREHGAEGLVDKRRVAVKSPVGRCPRQVREAMEHIAADLAEESRITDKAILDRVRRRAIELAKRDKEEITIPSDATLRRIWQDYKAHYALHISKKNQRGAKTRPQKATTPLAVSRPFEVIEVDSTPADIFVYNEISGKKERPWLSIATDVFSRSIVGWRFTLGSEKSIDVSLLLYDILTPHPWDPSWGEQSRWRYGVPERLVLPTESLAEDETPAGKPFGKPTTVTLDNGPTYASDAVKSVCARLGISLAYARTGRPTDKPHVERTFRTINEGFFGKLPGYTGSSTHDRGSTKGVEDRAILTLGELETLFAQWVTTVYQNRPHKGLRVPDMPSLTLTPNEKFDAGIAATGFIPVVVDTNTTVSLLIRKARKVTYSGIEYRGLFYDSPALDPYRNRKSPFQDLNGKHPVRVDPRDLSVVYFWQGDPIDPEVGEWVAIPSRIRDQIGAFSDAHLAYVKSLIAEEDRTGSHSKQVRVVEEAMVETFQRINALGYANRREENAFTLGDRRVKDSDATFPHKHDLDPDPLDLDNLESRSQEADDDADNEWDDVEPFPIAYDNWDIQSLDEDEPEDEEEL